MSNLSCNSISQGFTLLEQGYLLTSDMLSGMSALITEEEQVLGESSSTNTTTITNYYPILTTETNNNVELMNDLICGIVRVKQMEQELMEKHDYYTKKCQQQEEIILDLITCLKDLKAENEMLWSQFQFIIRAKQEQANSLSLMDTVQPAVPQPVINTPKEEPKAVTMPSRKRKRFDFKSFLPPSMVEATEEEKEETPAIQFVNHESSEIESWIMNYQESKTRVKRKYTKRKKANTSHA